MKIVLLGLSGSGKSSIAPQLAEKYDLKLIEADDEVMQANNNVWPFDDKFIDKVFEKTNGEVINMNNVLYVISWMETARIKDFYDKGFLIIEMHADYDELLKRKKDRNGMDEWQIKRFENTYTGYFESVLSEETKQYFALSIDTTKMTQDDAVDQITHFMTAFKKTVSVSSQMN